MEIRVLTENDKDMILNFERAKTEGDEMERSMAEWSAPWRGESLDHYLKLGWSLGVFKTADFNPDEFLGYYLGQVLLFFEGLTQTHWVEHLSYEDEETKNKLIDSSVRYARDKHLQRVLFPIGLEKSLLGYKVSQHKMNHIEVLTSKVNR